jgi:hypothetical protein
MERSMLQLPAHFSSLESEELVYMDGGRLSDTQANVLLWTASVLITSVTLMPNVYLYIFAPALSPITSTVESVTNSISSFFSSFFS